jgi:hypothetical protein
MSDSTLKWRELGRQIALEQDEALVQDLSLGSVRTRIAARRASRAVRWLAPAAAVAAAAIVAGLGVYAFKSRPAPMAAMLGDHALAVGEWVSATEPETPPIRFSDGSQITLAQGTRARLATLDGSGAHVVIESGSADVQVTPGRETRYRVSLGPFAVDVKGTRFDVGFRPTDELFTLALHEGRVVVSGCVLGEGRTLLAGESLSASCRAGHFEISAMPLPPPIEADVAALPSQPAEVVAPAVDVEPVPGLAEEPTRSKGPPSAATPPSWQELAQAGRFSEAYSLAASAGFDTAIAKAAPSELPLLGDVARLSGKPADALHAYQSLRRRSPGSSAAKQAAFSIARVHFDQRAAYAEAARWLRIYLAEQPRGPLAREAEGRLMEALSRAGDRNQARLVAETYLARHPKGPHARVARQLLGKP